MRIAHISDVHLSSSPAPRDIGATTEEQERVLHDVVRDIAGLDARPDVITVGGDLYDAGSTPDLRLLARNWIASLREIAPVLIVEGNHEQRRDVAILEREWSDGGDEGPNKHVVCAFTAGGVWTGERVTVGVLPWPRRGDLLAYAREHGLPVGVGNLHEACASAMRAVLDGFRLAFIDARKLGHACVILGHLDTDGARLDNGQPVVGKAFLSVSPHDLAATGADVVLLGHIHARQTIEVTDPTAEPRRMGWRYPIHYPGALKPTAVGQGDSFGYSVVDIQRPRPPRPALGPCPVSIGFRPIASVRRLVHVVAEPDIAGVLGFIDPPKLDAGASIRFTVRARDAVREQAQQQAEAWAQQWRLEGARVAVVLDIQRAERVAGGASVAAARSIPEKLEGWWETTGRPEDHEELLGMVETLEEEDRLQ